MSSVDERRSSEQRAKLQLLITLQEEAGAHQRLVRVPRDMLTVELLWSLMQCGDNGLVARGGEPRLRAATRSCATRAAPTL
jgi:hypothetical protein